MSDIAKNYARTFASPSGRNVIAHMRQITIERTFGPNASDAELRWAAAQAAFVHQIESLITRGTKDE